MGNSKKKESNKKTIGNISLKKIDFMADTKPLNTYDFHQIENSNQKISRLEKQVDHEKRLNDRLATEVKDLRIEVDRMKNSSQSVSQSHMKQLFDVKHQNESYAECLEKQNDEIQRLNGNVTDLTTMNTQLNDELNEKAEQMCQLHSENSR